MSSFDEWARRHPAAARDLIANVLSAHYTPTESDDDRRREEWASAQARLDVARQGAYSWRNNVGVTPSKCPECGARSRPVRYGLANDSAQLNQRYKSSDLILAIPRDIVQADVGKRIAQFGCVEVKRPGWVWTGTGREPAQAAWGALIVSAGGFFQFSTGEVRL